MRYKIIVERASGSVVIIAITSGQATSVTGVDWRLVTREN
jgi:hypothetical protein